DDVVSRAHPGRRGAPDRDVHAHPAGRRDRDDRDAVRDAHPHAPARDARPGPDADSVGRPRRERPARLLGALPAARRGAERPRDGPARHAAHRATRPRRGAGAKIDSRPLVALASITSSITSFIGDHGVYAVFLLMAIDAVFPAASELVMVY